MNSFITWYNRDPSRSNQHCLHCGEFVGADSNIESEEEHLIARRFVPKGLMENTFNFSFRACKPCNGRKADIERHVSSVTLLNSPAVALNEKARTSAERKAVRDFHPETRVRMGNAIERQTVEFKFGGASLKFGFTGPSPAAKNFIPELASYHIQALFSLLTMPGNHLTDEIRILPLDQFQVFDSYPHADWGNPQLVEITQRAATWPCWRTIETGDGHFRACLRRSEHSGWFWALEWNKSLRVVGCINHPGEKCPIFENLPILEWKALPDESGRFREEQGSPDLGDILFPGDH